MCVRNMKKTNVGRNYLNDISKKKEGEELIKNFNLLRSTRNGKDSTDLELHCYTGCLLLHCMYKK